MKLEELNVILKILDENRPQGVGIFTLSQKSGVEAQKLRQYLTKYVDYFVQLPEKQTYTINKFGRFKGSVTDMLQNHNAEIESKPTSNFVLYFIIFIGAFASLAAISAST